MGWVITNGDGGCSFWQPVQWDSQSKLSGLVLGWRPLGAILHSPNEPGELSQWLCHDDSTINIVAIIIISIMLVGLSVCSITQRIMITVPVNFQKMRTVGWEKIVIFRLIWIWSWSRNFLLYDRDCLKTITSVLLLWPLYRIWSAFKRFTLYEYYLFQYCNIALCMI